MEDKAEKIKQRFEKRQEARIEELKKKKADAIAKTDENETTEAFNSLFAKETKSINEILESLAATGLNKLVSSFGRVVYRFSDNYYLHNFTLQRIFYFI